MSASVYLAVLAAVGAERLVEVALSTRNARRLLARGAVEAGRGHFPVMVALHAAFLVACAVEGSIERSTPAVLSLAALAGAVLAQALRYWAIATLGERWNVRVIVLPGAEPVTGGPYRLVRHPNYVAVALEIACLALVRGAWITALVFSVANALLLRVRIRVEEEALGPGYARTFAGRPRFVP